MRSLRTLRLMFAMVTALLLLGAIPAHSTHNVPVVALAIDRRAPTTVYAGTYGGGGVFKSTDGGESWRVSGLAYIDALVIDPMTPTTLYAGIDNVGTYKSTDGGANWSSAGIGVITSLAVDPLTPTTLYAGTRGEGTTFGGVYKSTDGGTSWTAVVLFETTNGWFGEYCFPCGGVSALAIDPQTPTTIYGQREPITVYRDEWGEISWWTPSAVIKSTDGGLSWNAVGLVDLGVRVLAIDPLTPTTVYAASDSGVYKSADGGATWNASGGLVGVVASLAIDPFTPTTLYAGANDAVHKSTDGGVSWNVNTLTGAGPVSSLAIDPRTPTTLYAGTASGGVFKSANSGASWNPTGLITWTHISSISANPSSVVRGSPSIVTVTLSAPASAGGAVVGIYSPYVPAPASVTVAEGATSADFTLSTSFSTEDAAPVWIYAFYGGLSSFTKLTLTPGSVMATMRSPAAGSTLGGSTVTFDWNAGAGATQYWLTIGTTGIGSNDVYGGSQGTNLTGTVSRFPINGGPVYVRLWTLVGGTSWQFTDYIYTAATQTKAVLTSPAPGSTLGGGGRHLRVECGRGGDAVLAHDWNDRGWE